MMRRYSQMTILALALLAVCAWARGADDFSKGMLDRDAVMKVAAEITADEYPNADDVMVEDYIRVTYEADGRAVSWDDTFMKVLTEKGKRDNKTMSFYFTLPYRIAKVTLVEVIKPDGTVTPVDVEKQSRVMIDRSQMGSNIYNPNSKILQVGIPEVEIGDVVRYVVRREIVKPRVPDTWSDYQVFEYTSPIKRYVFEVNAPKSRPLKSIALKAPVEGTVTHTETTQGDRIVYKWVAADVPRMFPEPDMPALYTVVQRLLVSTIPDWRYISEWYWNLSEPHLKVTPEIEAKVAELTKGVKDRRGKIEAIFRWVSQEVRYMGITVEKEAPGYEPHDVSMTFEKRHGVCRDKAALLVAMLRAAGLEAWPVLIHNGPKKDEEVPQPYFNHAISAVEDDGEYLLMDSTDENTKDLFPAYLCDQSYLVAKPTGETLLVSGIIPAEQNMMTVETRGSIDAAGDLKAESTLKFEGINDNAYRGYFSRLKPEQRKRYFEGVLKSVTAGAVLKSFEVRPENLMDTTEPLSLRLVFEAPDVAVANDTTVMLPTPNLGSRVGMVNFVLRRAGLKKRKYPLETDYACGVHETMEIEVDPALGVSAALPDYPEIDDKTLSWRKTLAMGEPKSDEEARPSLLRSESEFKIKVVEFDPEQYAQLKDTLKTLEYNARKKAILRRAATPEAAEEHQADIVVLDRDDEYVLKDARNWKSTHSVAKKILTYKGKKDNAEVKLSYNPVWEDVKITTATVTTEGVTQTISGEELNLMDAGWVGSAPRYPAAKTLVASLPGVEIGSVVRYTVERTVKGRPFFALRASFRGENPIEKAHMRIVAPEGLDLSVQVMDPDGAIEGAGEDPEELDENRVAWDWTVTNQPGVKSEDALPPWWSFNPSVFVSSGDWSDWADRVEDALKSAARKQDAVRDRARALVRGIRDDDARVRAIRDFVARGIRGAGPGLGSLPLSAVTPADRTLEEGYGNSPDRAVLLYSMLRAAGFKPRFVLASYAPLEPVLQEAVLASPASSLFPSVLVRVEPDGREVYLNDTNQYDALGVTSHDRRPGLDAKSGEIDEIDADDDMRDRGEGEYDLEVRADGSAHLSSVSTYFGNSYGAQKRKFAEMPPEERDRYYQRVVAGVSQSAEADGDLVTEFDGYPGIEKFAVNVKRYAVRDGDYLYFTLPTSLRGLLHLRSDERTNPYYRGSYSDSETRLRIQLPKEFRRVILSPGSMRWNLPKAAGTVEVEESGPDAEGVLEIVYRVHLEPAVIPADDYARLLEIDRRLSHLEARTILLGRGE